MTLLNKVLYTVIISLFLSIQLKAQTNDTYRVYPYAHTSDQTEENLKYGLIDNNNNIIVKPQYEMIEAFTNPAINTFTMYKKKDKNGKTLMGIISNKGEIIEELEGRNINYDGNGKFVTIKNKKNLEIIDIITKKTIFDSDTAKLFQIVNTGKYYLIMQHRKKDYFYFINEEGNRLSNDTYEFKLFHRWTVNGLPVFKTQFNYKNSRNVDPNGKIYRTGRLADEDRVTPLPDYRNKRKGRDNDYKKKIIELVEKKTLGYRVDEFFEGRKSFVSIKKRKKYALANEDGKIIADCVYDEITPIKTDFYNKGKYDTENYILCRKKDKVGLINTEGEMILQPIFDIIDFDYEHKLFYVSFGDYSGYCTFDGKVMLPSDCECY